MRKDKGLEGQRNGGQWKGDKGMRGQRDEGQRTEGTKNRQQKGCIRQAKTGCWRQCQQEKKTCVYDWNLKGNPFNAYLTGPDMIPKPKSSQLVATAVVSSSESANKSQSKEKQKPGPKAKQKPPMFTKKENATGLVSRKQWESIQDCLQLWSCLSKSQTQAEWVKDEQKWQTQWESEQATKHMPSVDSRHIIHRWSRWISQAMRCGIIVTGKVLRQKWMAFAELVGIPEEDHLKLSDSWLRKFKIRYRLWDLKQHGDATSSDAKTIEEEQNMYKNSSKNHTHLVGSLAISLAFIIVTMLKLGWLVHSTESESRTGMMSFVVRGPKSFFCRTTVLVTSFQRAWQIFMLKISLQIWHLMCSQWMLASSSASRHTIVHNTYSIQLTDMIVASLHPKSMILTNLKACILLKLLGTRLMHQQSAIVGLKLAFFWTQPSQPTTSPLHELLSPCFMLMTLWSPQKGMLIAFLMSLSKPAFFSM